MLYISHYMTKIQLPQHIKSYMCDVFVLTLKLFNQNQVKCDGKRGFFYQQDCSVYVDHKPPTNPIQLKLQKDNTPLPLASFNTIIVILKCQYNAILHLQVNNKVTHSPLNFPLAKSKLTTLSKVKCETNWGSEKHSSTVFQCLEHHTNHLRRI
jgi:hypothetical protein